MIRNETWMIEHQSLKADESDRWYVWDCKVGYLTQDDALAAKRLLEKSSTGEVLRFRVKRYVPE